VHDGIAFAQDRLVHVDALSPQGGTARFSTPSVST
jgi:hypothetical protein